MEEEGGRVVYTINKSADETVKSRNRPEEVDEWKNDIVYLICIV